MFEPSRFEWRASLGSWRWLILSAIGAGAACGGKAGSEASSSQAGQGAGGSTSGVNPVSMGGSAMATPLPERGGAAGLGGMAGGAGTGNLQPLPQPSVCENETIQEGGVRRCSNGAVHRAISGSCSVALPLPELIDQEEYPADAGDYACRSNADCTEKPFGLCRASYRTLGCSYGCASDDDCDVGQACHCNGPAPGYCATDSCRTDADCAAGQLCASNTTCSTTRFVCTTKYDQCLVESDCPSGVSCSLAPLSEVNPLGALGGEYRKCEIVGCPVPGRPFLVFGEARLAPIATRKNWYSPVEGDCAPALLTPELRAELARGWTEQALMEHASIAAFARFTLQLLSLGAPAELVARSSEAMSDELRHAQDCFRLARRYSPSDLGPGPLPLAGALESSELCDVVLSTLREGCVGETVAAIEAAEALEHCTDVEARAVLERIAAEEARHAELAWRFVAWALETTAEPQRSELRRRIQATLVEELGAPVSASEFAERDRQLAQHGLLTPALRQGLRARVLREVVAPCAEALLASAPAVVEQARLVHVDIERQRTAALQQRRISARQVIAG